MRRRSIATILSALTRAIRSTRLFACFRATRSRTLRSSSRRALWPGPRRSADRDHAACSTSMPAHQQLQHRVRPVPAEEAAVLHDRQRPRRHSRPGRSLVDRAVGAEPVQQELCAGRVQLAVPVGRLDHPAVRSGLHLRAVHRSGISGRTPALLDVPFGTAHVRADVTGQMGRASAVLRRSRRRLRRLRRRRLRRPPRPARTGR